MSPTVTAVHRSDSHSFSKSPQSEVQLLAGIGVEGDAHSGETVKHRSRVRRDPSQPNLRQVHLIHAELFSELASRGYSVGPGDVGENITTAGVDLLALPRDTVLWIGETAAVRVTGLRNPCAQLDRFQTGLMQACLDRDSDGQLIRKSGVMGVVLEGGIVRAGDPITVELPPEPRFALLPV